jgi:hypothetical protein
MSMPDAGVMSITSRASRWCDEYQFACSIGTRDYRRQILNFDEHYANVQAKKESRMKFG